MVKRSETTIDPELLRLMDAARTPADEDAEQLLSDQIAKRLDPVAQRLHLRWMTDPSSPKRRPALYAQPKEYFALKGGLAQFAEAVATLTDGNYKTADNGQGTIVHHASVRLVGVDARIEIVLFEHEDHAECARRLPGLIDRHRRR
jgi:hypothetical protein